MSEAITCIEIINGELNTAMRSLPMPVAGEVLIKVAAAGINRPDTLQCRGVYPPPPGASDIPGLEIASTVAALGIDVTDLTVGKKVMALVTGGGYAQYCTPLHPNVSTIPIHWRWTRRRRCLRLF